MNMQKRKKVSGILWVCSMLLVLVWIGERGNTAHGPGIAYANSQIVASLEGGLVADISVQLHDNVEAKTVLAHLDPVALNHEYEVVSAELLAVQAFAASDAANNARRFSRDKEDALLDLARLTVLVMEDEALVAGLEERLSLEQSLENAGATSLESVNEVRREVVVAKSRLMAEQEALAFAQQAATDAGSRDQAGPLLNDWDVVAATRRLEQLEQRIERMTLTSQITGTITSIFRHPGEVVAAGEPILEVTEQYTTEVHAFLQPAMVLHVEQGQTAQLVRQNGEILTGLVVSAGTGPKKMPAILWTNAAAPQWGVPVRIQIQEGQLPSGEPVQVMI